MKENMKFLISPASECQLENGEIEGLFVGQDRELYNISIEFDADGVRIMDSVDRMVPVDIEDLGSLIKVLTKIDQYVKNTESCNDYLYQKLIQGASQ